MNRALAVVGALALVVCAGWAGAALADPPQESVRIVVAARDLPVGTVLTKEDLAQRTLPAALVTRSMVSPDSASYAIGQPLLVPLLKGDWVLWQWVDLPGAAGQLKACIHAAPPAPDARSQVAHLREAALHGGTRPASDTGASR